MWAVTDLKALAGCHRWRAPGVVNVPLTWGDNGTSKWAGLQNSHSVWGSPVAAVAISRQRIREVTTAVENWRADHSAGAWLLATFTVPHNREESLAAVWAGLQGGWAAVIGTTTWGKERERYGIHHWHKSVEITEGINGWHPHAHVLMFLDRRLSATELEALKSGLYERHARGAVKKGMKRPTLENGVDIVQVTGLEDARRAGSYVVKGPAETWGVGAEAAGGAFKSAAPGHRTAWEILDDVAAGTPGTPEYARDVALWREYERTTKGKRQTAWSGGAKDALRVIVLEDTEIDTDGAGEETASAPARDRYVVATVPPSAWSELAEDPRRLEAEEYVAEATGPREAQRRAREILTRLGVEHDSLRLRIEPGGRAWRVAAEESRSVLQGAV